MNFICSRFFLFFLLVSFSFRGFCQTEKPFDPLADEFSSKLPPLSVLIDSALANDHYVRFRNLQVSVNTSKMKEVQYEWTRNFGILGNLGYGTFDYLYVNSFGGQTPPTYTMTQNLTQYGIGAYLRFPIFDVVGRNNLVTLAKTETQQAREMIAVQSKEVRERVITQYNTLIEKHNLLKIRVKYVETSRINMQMAEKEYANGVISISEFTRISEIVNRAETEFETSKMEFRTAHMLLEETVGMKLNVY